MKNNRYYYLVEGECEKKLVEEFKSQKDLIIPGKVLTFNVVQEKITRAFLTTIPENAVFILIFDTDTSSDSILKANINVLSNHKRVKNVWCITQVNNLEDELVRSTNVSRVRFITGSTGDTNYKHDLITEKRLYEKLMIHGFDFSKFWSTSPTGIFSEYENQSRNIKL